MDPVKIALTLANRYLGTAGIVNMSLRNEGSPYIVAKLSAPLSESLQREIEDAAHPLKVQFVDSPLKKIVTK